ncbi:hypothetical protein ACWER6_35765 [Streptomyces sp. NPDC004009]
MPSPGFHVRLDVEGDGGRLRVDFSDIRAERRPAFGPARGP